MPLADNQKVNMAVVIKGTLLAGGGQAQSTINVLHYTRTSFAQPFSATAFLTAFQAAIQADWLAVASASWTWNKTGIRVINSPTEAEVEAVVNAAGGIAGECEPGHIAMLIAKKTALRGRKYQGRMFICGVGESANNGNALTNAHKTLLDTLATSLVQTITDANGTTFVPAVLSMQPPTDLTVDPSVVTQTPISSFVARQIVARMDSRASKVLS